MKQLIYRNMKQSILENPRELDGLYECFKTMKELGYIEEAEWRRLDVEVSDWEYNEKIDAMLNTSNGRAVRIY